MNKKTLVCILSVLMGLTVLLPVGSAENIVTDITAQLNNSFTILWDGEVFIPKDASGYTLAPIVYQDRVYVPLRSFGEKSGAAVSWDPNTRVATITSPDTSVPPDNITPITPIDTTPQQIVHNYSLITQFVPYHSEGNWTLGSIDIADKRYNPAYFNSGLGQAIANWALDKQYAHMTIRFGSINDTDDAQGVYVYADGASLYNSPQFDAGNFIDFELDLSGRDELQIVLLPNTSIITAQIDTIPLDN